MGGRAIPLAPLSAIYRFQTSQVAVPISLLFIQLAIRQQLLGLPSIPQLPPDTNPESIRRIAGLFCWRGAELENWLKYGLRRRPEAASFPVAVRKLSW